MSLNESHIEAALAASGRSDDPTPSQIQQIRRPRHVRFRRAQFVDWNEFADVNEAVADAEDAAHMLGYSKAISDSHGLLLGLYKEMMDQARQHEFGTGHYRKYELLAQGFMDAASEVTKLRDM